MTALLLALLLCWDRAPVRWEIEYMDLWVTGRAPCPTADCPDCTCPTYSPRIWQTGRLSIPRFQHSHCAENPGGVCVYRHSVAVDKAGRRSAKPMLLWPPPTQGGCP